MNYDYLKTIAGAYSYIMMKASTGILINHKDDKKRGGMMTEDERLICKIQYFDSDAAKNKLLHKYYDEIYAYVYRHILNVEDSLDLTQEIFINILKGLSAFDRRKASFRTWIYRIASNRMTDWYRCRHFTSELSDDLPDDSRFEEVIENKAFTQKILDFVKKYDYASYWIMELKFFSNLTFKEIGEITELSENTVKTKYYHAIKKIRKEFSGYESGISV